MNTWASGTLVFENWEYFVRPQFTVTQSSFSFFFGVQHWLTGEVENSKTSENVFPRLFHSGFSILHNTQNRKLGDENLGFFSEAFWSNYEYFQSPEVFQLRAFHFAPHSKRKTRSWKTPRGGGNFNFFCTGVCGHKIGKLTHPQTKAGPSINKNTSILRLFTTEIDQTTIGFI